MQRKYSNISLFKNPFSSFSIFLKKINLKTKMKMRSEMKQIIQRSFIFNNQTETIAASQTSKFVTGNQPYLRKY